MNLKKILFLCIIFNVLQGVETKQEQKKKVFLDYIHQLIESNSSDTQILKALEYYLSTVKGDINARYDFGDTLLHTAAFYDRPVIAEYLISKSADLEATITRQGHDNVTCLMAAAMNNSTQVMKVLLNAGAKADKVTSKGYNFSMMGVCFNPVVPGSKPAIKV